MCLPAATPTARASASPLLTPSPRAPRSRACLCVCAGALATRVSPLQCGRRAQRLAPPPLTVALCTSLPRPPRREPEHPHCSRCPHAHRSRACPRDCAGALAKHISLQCGRRAQRLAPPLLSVALCASQPRPPRREPVHPHCSRRLHTPDAHAHALLIALAHLPRPSLLCSVAAAPIGWHHHRSRSRCVPHCRDPHGESQCIPTAHVVSTRTTLTRVPLCLPWRTCHAHHSSAVWRHHCSLSCCVPPSCAYQSQDQQTRLLSPRPPVASLADETPLSAPTGLVSSRRESSCCAHQSQRRQTKLFWLRPPVARLADEASLAAPINRETSGRDVLSTPTSLPTIRRDSSRCAHQSQD